METYNDRIRAVGREASEWLYAQTDLKMQVKDRYDLEVTAFDFEGEPYSLYVRKILHNCVENSNGDKIYFDDLSTQSVARVADYVMEHKKK